MKVIITILAIIGIFTILSYLANRYKDNKEDIDEFIKDKYDTLMEQSKKLTDKVNSKIQDKVNKDK